MVTPSAEIKEVILEWYRSIESGEMIASAEEILSRERGFLAIGTAASEWFTDRADLIRAYAETAKLGRPVIDVPRIEAFCEGQVGWAVDNVMLRRPGKPVIPMRHTFVLHKEGTEWKVVHAHYSISVPDESEALPPSAGQSLSTSQGSDSQES